MEENQTSFQKLTPTKHADIKIYNEALDFVFENEDITNIGITGAYSAGKSSIIESYKDKKTDLSFLHISLACFQPNDREESSTEQSESILEGKILNQLIHQIDPTFIPQTNFKIKHKTNYKSIGLLTASIVLFALLLTYCFNVGVWKAFVSSLIDPFNNLLWFTTSPLTVLIVGAIIMALFSYFIYKLIQLQINKNLFKGITFQGNKIEIFEQCDESYFDKYLNEVIYLFENTQADAIVFEDIDRFNNNQIFQRLREINTLVNKRKKLVNKKNDKIENTIRFFYLLRDDLFISKERTKFFDFIIPVIPVLDSSNSYDQLITHFRRGNVLHFFDQNFLFEVSLYIDDMRILKNIYNEFLIYHKRISTTEQNPNKLLAMIIYKNIFPKDFSDLQLNKGYVFTLFNKKNDLKKANIQKLKCAIDEIKREMEKIEGEHLESEAEVNIVYASKIGQGSSKKQIETYEKEKNERLQNLKNKSFEYQEVLNKRVNKLETEIAHIQQKKLSELINRENANNVFKVECIDEVGMPVNFIHIYKSDYFPLIKYLIRNGYIDETYPDYMTYFYGNSISQVDKVFLRSVTDEIAKDYSYLPLQKC